jgi:hypothetical protein
LEKHFRLLEKIAKGRVTIAHADPKDVLRMVGWSRWSEQRTPDAPLAPRRTLCVRFVGDAQGAGGVPGLAEEDLATAIASRPVGRISVGWW